MKKDMLSKRGIVFGPVIYIRGLYVDKSFKYNFSKDVVLYEKGVFLRYIDKTIYK